MKPCAPPAAAACASGVPARLRPHVPRIAAFLIVFSVGYSLGIVSSSTRPTPKPSQTVIRPHAAHLTAGSSLTTTTGASVASNGTAGYPRSPPHDLFRFRDECREAVPADAVVQTLLDKLFDGESPYASFPPAHTEALLHPATSRPRGWGSTGAVFAELIEEVRPDTIVELGAFLGASALHMAAVARNLSLSPTILCIDDFRGWPAFRGRFRRDVPAQRHGDVLLLPQFMANVVAAGAADRVLPLPFSTASALLALCQWGVYADLIEVDAGHDFHSAWADINLAWAVLRPGGVMFGHDYFTGADDRGVRRAVTLFAKVKGLSVRPHGQHWILSPKPHGDARR
jgi:predicted O-methyltransferase YrrM